MKPQADSGRYRTSQVVLDAIIDLHNQEQPVTRESLAEATGIKMSVIDDHVTKFVDDEVIRRVRRGLFVPLEQFPPARPVSVTTLPNGVVKLEIGDMCLDLRPREARLVATHLMGHGIHFSNIQAGHEAGIIASEMSASMRRMERELESLRQDAEDRKIELMGRSTANETLIARARDKG